MKKFILFFFLLFSLSSYGQEVTKIKNDSLEFEITIIDPTFNVWLIGNARPRGFYRLEYLEFHNQYLVTDWNTRFFSSTKKDLYQFYIDYDPNLKYGYEVNYMLFNYFQYFKTKTGERIGIRSR